MHYRNGREAKNGDRIIKLGGAMGSDGVFADGKVIAFGVLHSAKPGDDYCNGNIASIQDPREGACMVDCLHVEDVEAMLKQAGLDKRPPGK